jgi:hypothetical protein
VDVNRCGNSDSQFNDCPPMATQTKAASTLSGELNHENNAMCFCVPTIVAFCGGKLLVDPVKT